MSKILIFSFSCMMTFLILMKGSELYFFHKSRQGNGSESFYSKLELLKNQRKIHTVFLGTSTVQNQINTKFLNGKDIRSFNLGLPGIYWEEYHSSSDCKDSWSLHNHWCYQKRIWRVAERSQALCP